MTYPACKQCGRARRSARAVVAEQDGWNPLKMPRRFDWQLLNEKISSVRLQSRRAQSDAPYQCGFNFIARFVNFA